MSVYQEIISSVSPVFTFVRDLWSVLPLHFRYLFAAFFAFFIGFTMVRNLMS